MKTRHPKARRRLRSLLILLALPLLGVVACSNDPSTSPDSVAAAAPAKIEWFKGDIDSAFAYAKTAGKPMFLYWGAEWCPPCHYLKNKIFTRPEFVARMQQFVPIYLDGDTERAQILGETLDVKGYPTVIIFDPLGQEVMRMPSTVPVEQYEAILDAAVANMRPVKVVLEEVLAAGPATANESDVHLLAFYSWGQDSQVDLSADEEVEAFGRLYHETPADRQVERARFLGLYLVALAGQARASESAESALSPEETAAASQAVIAVLEDASLRNANLLWIEYYAPYIIDLLHPEDTPERHELLGAWERAADAMENDPALSIDDRLSATVLKLDLVSLAAHPDAKEVRIPTAMQEHVRQRAAWAIETVTDESELQTVVNTLAHMLESADLNEEAEAMLLAKMHDTAAPYYFMSWIGSLREEAGDSAGALEWYRKAYDASQGRYSRFRWGSTYLRRLMTLSPESAERIEAESVEVLGELLTHDDAFSGGNHARLDGLQSAYWTWNEDSEHDAELGRIRDFVQASCEGFVDESGTQEERCIAFLVPEEVEGEAAM